MWAPKASHTCNYSFYLLQLSAFTLASFKCAVIGLWANEKRKAQNVICSNVTQLVSGRTKMWILAISHSFVTKTPSSSKCGRPSLLPEVSLGSWGQSQGDGIWWFFKSPKDNFLFCWVEPKLSDVTMSKCHVLTRRVWEVCFVLQAQIQTWVAQGTGRWGQRETLIFFL